MQPMLSMSLKLGLLFGWAMSGPAQSPSIPAAGQDHRPATPSFVLAEPMRPPVITDTSPGCEDNNRGFEGGSVVKVDGLYHLFIAEMYTDPFWWGMRLGHWTSADALQWQRMATVFQSGGKPDPHDDYASIWAPMPIFNEKENRWNLFYIAYRGPKPDEIEGHYNGRILRAASRTPGREGIGGPYEDIDVSLQPDAHSQPWEGQQGTDSFYPYCVGERWYGLYGSHNHQPISAWPVGLATAPALDGPWTRCPGVNPLPIDRNFIENPIVTRLDDGRYAAVYDSCDTGGEPGYQPDPRTIGLAFSSNGIDWEPGRFFNLGPADDSNWSSDIRTPLGLIAEGDDLYTLLYTAKLKDRDFWAVGRARLRLETTGP